ncbi:MULTISPECIES: lipopolysaccharide biosynthesis protein [Cyanophyceae]|uniref:lipopolysaccharide biosynthesis protein n=1 Tax=Cyanophyceae TaxID=3028117 RepID=UPI0016854496|nr:lipopolysaccharide biosynthesis protein [Trichocoleus sp. FACHB-69]MBD1935707.1 lipopolysaccharide biosynthesis protein [Trichocoleus sp. FACHB-69]
MQTILAIVPKLKKKLSNPFIRNIGWMGMSELVPRILRIGVIVVLARYLTSYDYGLGAIVLTVGDFTRVFTNVGINAQIIQTDKEKEDLNGLCNSAYWLNWLIYFALFAIQCILAFPISWFYKEPRLILPICVGAIGYLFWPTAAIQCALIQRENRLKICAINNLTMTSISYVSSAVIAYLGMGVWAFVLPGLLTSPIAVFIYRHNHAWRPTKGITTKYWKELLSFGKNILGVEFLKTLRNSLDYLIVGRFLGVKELGIYFFGFNGGLGVSLSIINAISSSVYPHLCAARSNKFELKKRYLESIKVISFVIVPLVILQSSLAPFYVPVIFGQKWVVAIPILIVICLSAIPRPFADTSAKLLVAIGKPNLEFRWNIVFTGMFIGALFMGIHWGAIGVAISVFLVHVICLPLFTFWATRYVFPKNLSI